MALKIQALDYTKTILMSEPIILRQRDQWGNKPTWLSSWWSCSSKHQRTWGLSSASTLWKSNGFTQLQC